MEVALHIMRRDEKAPPQSYFSLSQNPSISLISMNIQTHYIRTNHSITFLLEREKLLDQHLLQVLILKDDLIVSLTSHNYRCIHVRRERKHLTTKDQISLPHSQKKGMRSHAIPKRYCVDAIPLFLITFFNFCNRLLFCPSDIFCFFYLRAEIKS